MFSVIKNLFRFKPKITQIYPIKKLSVGETRQDLESRILELEKKITKLEFWGGHLKPEKYQEELIKYFEEKIENHSKLEKEYIRLEIDRIFLEENKQSIKSRNCLPWINEKNGKTIHENNSLYELRIIYTWSVIEKTIKLRRKGFKLIKGGKLDKS